MKLLLTSAGVKNPSIHAALVGLLGKPIADSSALCIPTALYGHPQGSPGGAWRFIAGKSGCPMCELGWKSLGVLELTALPSIGESAGSPGSGRRMSCWWRAAMPCICVIGCDSRGSRPCCRRWIEPFGWDLAPGAW